MKTLTIHEAKGQLAQLIAAAHEGESIVLTDGDRRVALEPRKALDLEEDSPELEAELLKAVGSPVTPYSREEMRARFEQLVPPKAPAMTLVIHKTERFAQDADIPYEWDRFEAGEEVVGKFEAALDATLGMLASQPAIGRRRSFRSPELRDLPRRLVELPGLE